EDGIRDKLVTGVQTCALPISSASTKRTPSWLPRRQATWQKRRDLPSLLRNRPNTSGRALPCAAAMRAPPSEMSNRTHGVLPTPRSEERRVGKEGGSRRGGET